jgi:hypothetical protein
MNYINYSIETGSKKHAMKLFIALFAIMALLYALTRFSWWSFTQTVDFLRPAFNTIAEAVVVAIIVQYGPQPALFFVGVYYIKLGQAIMARDNYLAEHRGRPAPWKLQNEVVMNTAALIISVLFFLGLSILDFITNVGEINNYRADATAQEWSAMLYWVMITFAFIVLWVEELAGNLFVYMFAILEAVAVMFGFKGHGFFRQAQGAFTKLSGRSGPTQNSGPEARSYPERTAQGQNMKSASATDGDDEGDEGGTRAQEAMQRAIEAQKLRSAQVAQRVQQGTFQRPAPKPVDGRKPSSEPTYHQMGKLINK